MTKQTVLCPRCQTILIPGYAIDPGLHERCCFGFGRSIINKDNLKFIFVLKCPNCGHSEEIKDQEEFARNNLPEGYKSWVEYWKEL